MRNELGQVELGLVRLKRRADFLRVARTGRRHAAPGLVLQVADGRAESGRAGKGVEASVDASVGIGFTASKKSRQRGGAQPRQTAFACGRDRSDAQACSPWT